MAFRTLNRSLLLSILGLGVGIFSQALASTSGALTYQFTGYTADATCTSAPSNQQREDFSGTVTDAGESIFADSLTFSICNDPGSYTGGIFSLTDPEDGTISGTFAGVDLGDTFSGGIDYQTVQGTFTVTSEADNGYSDMFLAETQENINTGAGSATFVIGAPEPATMALAGLGLLMADFVRRRRLTHIKTGSDSIAGQIGRDSEAARSSPSHAAATPSSFDISIAVSRATSR
jgi:hypothetical protein